MNLARYLAFAALLVSTAALGQTISVVRFQGGTPPITQAGGTLPAGFVGYFSPRAGEQFDVKQPDGTWDTHTTIAEGGGRFGESRGENQTHDGVDLIGWVEKVSEDGRPPGYLIHLFDSSWSVHNRIAGKVGGVNSPDRDGISVSHPPALSNKEEYEHITVPASYSMGNDVASGATLGTLTRTNLGTNEWTHLHYACTNNDGVYVDPFAQTGARGLYEFTVPEPSSIGLALAACLLLRRCRIPR